MQYNIVIHYDRIDQNFASENFRTCLHKKCMWIFEHNFVADKAKMRRRAVGRNPS